jgi:hypothetical protein
MDYSIWPASHATESTTGGANEKASRADRSSPRPRRPRSASWGSPSRARRSRPRSIVVAATLLVVAVSSAEEIDVVRYLCFAANSQRMMGYPAGRRKEPERRGKFMAQRLATKMPLFNRTKRRDSPPTSRTVSALLAAVGVGFAVSALIVAPVAAAQVCGPDQVEVNGQCTPLQNAANPPVLPPGTPGKIQCTQHSCVYRPDA